MTRASTPWHPGLVTVTGTAPPGRIMGGRALDEASAHGHGAEAQPGRSGCGGPVARGTAAAAGGPGAAARPARRAPDRPSESRYPAWGRLQLRGVRAT